ncbi:MAG: DUF2934 domain-containing protein [Nitrospira sp.]|nr:MAG: DUF2934 domain-containing protein [Nitrospira sp.]
MASATKPTKKMKSSMRSPLAASPRSIELPNGMRERIATKAFELWQERGYRDGHDFEDSLIADMERHDPGTRRVGQPSFDYNRLRAHVGLD